MATRRSSDGVYNFITVVSLLGTIGVIIGVIVALVTASPRDITPLEQTQIAEAIIPSPTASATWTETPTVTPTATATATLTPTETLTPTPSFTPTVSPAPTATITDTPAPTFTPSQTFTPEATATITPTDTPIGPTPTFTASPSPFLFSVRDQPQFVRNFANAAQCAWQGIGGQVVNLNGTPFVGNINVHVYNNQLDTRVPIGSNSLYGSAGPNGETSGWEVRVGDTVNNLLYFVELESQSGTKVSDTAQIQFSGSCEANAAIVTFVQNRPIQ